MNETNGEVYFTYEKLEAYLEQPTTHLVVCLDDKKVIGAHVLFTFGSEMITRYNCFDSDYAKISPSARIDYEMIKKYNGVCINTSCQEVLNISKETYNNVKEYIEDILN